ncbi:NfeD family protein [Endozoicomonadaceae bacterium StTr2]
MEFFQQIEPWHWLIVMFACLGMEALGASGFLLGSAFSALLLALALWLLPDMGWAAQLIWFGIGSLVFSLAYWKFFRSINEKNDHPELNNRASQLVGHVFVLAEDLPNGQGRVQIGDTFWKVRATETLTKASSVKVTGYEGMILMLEKHDS